MAAVFVARLGVADALANGPRPVADVAQEVGADPGLPDRRGRASPLRRPLLAWDWTAVETVLDVGGGNGAVLRALLSAHPHVRGVVFDLPSVILRSVRAAMRDDAVLLVLELIVPDDGAPHPAKLVDLQMLFLLGGRERTRPEWAELLHRGGFDLAAVVEGRRANVIEARPAG